MSHQQQPASAAEDTVSRFLSAKPSAAEIFKTERQRERGREGEGAERPMNNTHSDFRVVTSGSSSLLPVRTCAHTRQHAARLARTQGKKGSGVLNMVGQGKGMPIICLQERCGTRHQLSEKLSRDRRLTKKKKKDELHV